MRKLLIAAFVLLAGCTDAEKGDIFSLGTAGHVVCYSGGQKIYEGDSSGKVINHTDSNGFYFVEAKTRLFIDVQADCVVTHP